MALRPCENSCQRDGGSFRGAMKPAGKAWCTWGGALLQHPCSLFDDVTGYEKMRPVSQKVGIRCPFPKFLGWPLVGAHSLLFGSLRTGLCAKAAAKQRWQAFIARSNPRANGRC